MTQQNTIKTKDDAIKLIKIMSINQRYIGTFCFKKKGIDCDCDFNNQDYNNIHLDNGCYVCDGEIKGGIKTLKFLFNIKESDIKGYDEKHEVV